MNEDVKKIVEELTRLYDDGTVVIAKFEHAYEIIVPSRINIPQMEVVTGAYGFPQITTRNSSLEPEHSRLVEIVKKVDEYAEKWVKSVNDLLGKVKQTRFKLQFNNPNQKGFLSSSFGETTPTENHLLEVIDDLDMRHAELRQIILEIERSADQMKPIKAKEDTEQPVGEVAYKLEYDSLSGKLYVNDKLIQTLQLDNTPDVAFQKAMETPNKPVSIKGSMSSTVNNLKIPLALKNIMFRVSKGAFQVNPIITENDLKKRKINKPEIDEKLQELAQ
jgi:hypothetical protein